MFATLAALPPDSILGLIEVFRADPREHKVDLGVGVYRTEAGVTPILAAVKQAEALLYTLEDTKSYIAPPGTEGFNLAMQRLLLGDQSPLFDARRVGSVLTPGGCGALRIGAELLKRAKPDATIWVSNPTWANHIPLLGNAGLQIQTYPYYDANVQEIAFDEMAAVLEQVPAGDVVLLHACCHNPSGADLTLLQWQRVAEIASSKGWLPFVDIAYQGLGNSLDEDAAGLRLIASKVPEMLIAASCSKNFGLYRERTGLLAVIAQNSKQTAACLSQLVNVARGIYSMPPFHGAALVEIILHSEELTALWHAELTEMRERINQLRKQFVARMTALVGDRSFTFIERQRGMFSFLGIVPAQVAELREQYGIYMVDSSRINIAGMNSSNMDYLCESIAAVLKSSNA